MLDQTETTRPAELQGLVDNATSTHLYGWAWNAADPAERVSVQLRLAETVVASTIAGRDRHDLAKAGVGDGRHAFELPMKPEWAKRRTELAVVACAAGGAESALALRIRRADVDETGAVQRVLEATATAHRQLQGELARLAERLPGEDLRQDAAIRALSAGQDMLGEKLETLTLWLVRMDDRLAALAPAPGPPARRQVDAWQLLLGAALGLVLLGAGFGTALLLRG